MKKPELLSPVGNMECLKAAIHGGCDAVYLGGYTFGARNFAGNFSDEEMIIAINYAHLYGVKVYVTVNTLIYDDEVETFINYIDFLHKNNVDAIIIQDLGMMDLVRKTYPNLEIHASTQMHIHNLEGVKFASDMGFKRVVLARETNYELLKEIKEKNNIELEVFIHGALCMSYSGQCLMSYFLNERSGNRGTCSQPCRMKYDIISDNKKVNKFQYLLSTKDLNTINNIGKLIDIGIDSLKIEGRMKRPEYVYLITKLYRKAIDNYILNGNVEIKEEDILEMKKLFNREFTRGFLFNEDNDNFTNEYRPNHLGVEIGQVIDCKNKKITIKLNDNVHQGDGIRIIDNEDIGFNLNKIYKNGLLVNSGNKGDIIEVDSREKVSINSRVLKTTDIRQIEKINNEMKENTRKIKIKGVINCYIGKQSELIFNDGVNEVIITGPIVEESKKIYMDNKNIEKQIKKLGDTVYQLEELVINRDNNIFIKINDLNELRRKASELLNEKRLYNIPYVKSKYEIELEEYKEDKGMSILVNNLEEYEKYKNDNFKYIYVNDKELLNIFDKRIIYKNPRVLEKVEKHENSLNGELGSLYINKGYSDNSLNIVNSYGVAFLHSIGIKRITLSYEMSIDNVRELINCYKKRYNKEPNLEIIIDSYPEVMVTKYDILKKHKIEKGYLRDVKNRNFKIKKINNITYIYNFNKIKLPKEEYIDIVNTLRIEK